MPVGDTEIVLHTACPDGHAVPFRRSLAAWRASLEARAVVLWCYECGLQWHASNHDRAAVIDALARTIVDSRSDIRVRNVVGDAVASQEQPVTAGWSGWLTSGQQAIAATRRTLRHTSQLLGRAGRTVPKVQRPLANVELGDALPAKGTSFSRRSVTTFRKGTRWPFSYAGVRRVRLVDAQLASVPSARAPLARGRTMSGAAALAAGVVFSAALWITRGEWTGGSVVSTISNPVPIEDITAATADASATAAPAATDTDVALPRGVSGAFNRESTGSLTTSPGRSHDSLRPLKIIAPDLRSRAARRVDSGPTRTTRGAVLVPAGTTIPLILDTEVPADAKAGHLVRGRVSRNVLVGNRVVIPRASILRGRVVDASRKRSRFAVLKFWELGRARPIVVTFTSIRLPAGPAREYQMRTSSVELRARKVSIPAAAGATTAGAIVTGPRSAAGRALTGAALAGSRSDNARLARGTAIDAKTLDRVYSQ
jgi:hypothetical protein